MGVYTVYVYVHVLVILHGQFVMTSSVCVNTLCMYLEPTTLWIHVCVPLLYVVMRAAIVLFLMLRMQW